jgi:hypothetical protein
MSNKGLTWRVYLSKPPVFFWVDHVLTCSYPVLPMIPKNLDMKRQRSDFSASSHIGHRDEIVQVFENNLDRVGDPVDAHFKEVVM